MSFDEQESVIVITEASAPLEAFLSEMVDAYDKIHHKNLIVDLSSRGELALHDLLLFRKISDRHKKKKKSFVIVNDTIHHDEIPEALVVVPTIQEAYDIIAMEDIERDLGF
ncbi:MAG: ribonuclease Z [Bacteroidota bacterium]